MRKLVTLAIVALFAISANAQQGSMYIGAGNINFWDEDAIGTGFVYSKAGDDKFTSFGLSPEFGYFISDNIAIGGIVGFNSSKLEEGDAETKEFSFRINPYVRYYAYQAGNFGFYIQGGVNYERETEAEINKIGVNFMPGVAYSISSKFTATATFGNLAYEYMKQDDADDSQNTFGLNLNMASLNFGLVYNF